MQSCLVIALTAVGAAQASSWTSEDQKHQISYDKQRLAAKLDHVTSLKTATAGVRDMLAGNKTLISELLPDGQSGASATKELQANARSLETELGGLRGRAAAAQLELPGLEQAVRRGQQCQEDLEQSEGVLAEARDHWARTARGYTAADTGNPLNPAYGEMWGAADHVKLALYALFLEQKKCAPASRKIRPVYPPHACSTDTGGSCWILPCFKWRNATACTDDKCVCGAGWCSLPARNGAGGGICHARGQPPVPREERFAFVDELSEGPVEGPGETHGVVGSIVLLFAFTTAAVAAVAWRRRTATREVVSSSSNPSSPLLAAQ